MKIFPFKIPKPKEEALIYQEDKEVVFYGKLHQHEEIQISYIANGEGNILVGDTITGYQKGNVIVLGSNLPHVFRSEINTDETSVMMTLFFTADSFGNNFFDLPEFKILESFFTSIKNGFKIDAISQKTVNQFNKLKKANEFDRFILFFKLIKSICLHEKKALSNFIYDKPFTDREGKRMQLVFDYVMTNYQRDISLEEIASLSNMTKNAFCRYFKLRTNKTFFQFLIDIRIERASKLLLKNRELSVIEIAELCGFNNISNFNRKFKELKHSSPLQYRKLNT
ncbi:helix-turn-helix transcriptional regulator [Flavobacterium sp. ZT3R18]|uniref:AraC family transcriptional regulator n=1 Tax=Flavobacterium sp. ZT3R18 TaxID=2594429 RepID=UPI00117B0BCE|nr:AraC family transcriptional regulator [Flavobacterium sp. ZT3R18]TRX34048.1 helix-turn-helix transcriptional regulator [Flavobacterium sp. ZT3R18]